MTDASRWRRDWVTRNIHHIDGFGQRQEPHVSLIVHHVERHVQLLQLQEIVLSIQHLRVELEEAIPCEVQSLKPFHASQCFENDGRRADLRNRGERVTRQIQLLNVVQVEHVIWELLEIVCRQVK